MEKSPDQGRKLPIYKDGCIADDAGKEVIINTFGRDINDRIIQSLKNAPGIIVEGPVIFEHWVRSAKRFGVRNGKSRHGHVRTDTYWLVRLSDWDGDKKLWFGEKEVYFS